MHGRRVVFVRKEAIEELPDSLDGFDTREILIERRLADLSIAQAAYEAAVATYPDSARACARCAA